MWKHRFSAAAALLLIAACAPPPLDGVSNALAACQRGAQHDEIRDSGTVVRVLGYGGSHEGFLLMIPLAAGNGSDRVLRAFRVEDNTDITGPIPLHAGERIAFQGQFECSDDAIHWTHRDPAGRHIDGYIEADGKTYR
ncbi:MAG TPA: DUF3465 domain-containing protein [Candidatus Baltobacteraceae bacterium]|nr:DUF3465 domain-containing protein [Candidatus Baltobacteraceae bacterium]